MSTSLWLSLLTNLSLALLGNCIITSSSSSSSVERNSGSAAFVSTSRNHRRFAASSSSTILKSTSASSALRDGRSGSNNSGIIHTYLGRGSSAIVREGCVLVAPSHEYHHLLMKSAIYIYAIGLNDENERVARGVIIDHPTAFSVSEMIDESTMEGIRETFGKNTLFRGGDLGEDIVMMLHSHADDDSDQEMIGSSGLYEGGLSYIIDAARKGFFFDPANSVKFFFNYLEFTEQQLDLMFGDDDKVKVEQGEGDPATTRNRIRDDSDGWTSVEVHPSFVLRGDYERGSAWERLRNQVRHTLLANKDREGMLQRQYEEMTGLE